MDLPPGIWDQRILTHKDVLGIAEPQARHPTLGSKSEKSHRHRGLLVLARSKLDCCYGIPTSEKTPTQPQGAGFVAWASSGDSYWSEYLQYQLCCGTHPLPPNLADLEFVQFGLHQAHVVPVHGPSSEQDAHSHPLLWHLTLVSYRGWLLEKQDPCAALCTPRLRQASPFPATSGPRGLDPRLMTSIKTFVMFVSDFPFSTRALIG